MNSPRIKPVFCDALRASKRHGFTLIEIMIVVAIMGLIALISIPAIYHALHPESLQKAVTDVMDACGSARSRAIWTSAPVELRIHPMTGSFEVVNAPQDVSPVEPSAMPGPGSVPQDPAAAEAKPATPGLSGQINDRVRINMLDVNFREYKDADEARVRFYPNGTCDELTIVLQSMDTGESRKITLELVTALPEVSPFP